MKDRQAHSIKLLLLTAFPCDYPFGGGAIIKEIVEGCNAQQDMCWLYSDEYATSDSPTPIIEGIDARPYHIPAKRRWMHTAIDYYLFYIYAGRFVAQHKALIAKSAQIWIILERYMVPIAYHLLKEFPQANVHISVHDDCREDYDYYKGIGREKVTAYMQFIFERANSVDVIGEHMRRSYLEAFGVDSIVYRRGVAIEAADIKPPQADSNAFHWVFVGSSHSDALWEELFEKVSQSHMQFIISFIGNPAPFERIAAHAPSNCQCRIRGIMDEKAILAEQQHFDAAIFFWDDMPENRLRYSVSTKLTSYLRMGLPMVGIVAKQAEVYHVIEDGLCFDLRQAPLSALPQWASAFDRTAYINYARKYFHPTAMAQKMRALLDIDTTP